jgi:hypothetical protein
LTLNKKIKRIIYAKLVGIYEKIKLPFERAAYRGIVKLVS